MGKVRNKASKGRGTPNRSVSTARGRRRKEKTQEYLDNLSTRGSQSYPKVTQTQRGPGPLKGPSKRTAGTSNTEWVNIMTGKSR